MLFFYPTISFHHSNLTIIFSTSIRGLHNRSRIEHAVLGEMIDMLPKSSSIPFDLLHCEANVRAFCYKHGKMWDGDGGVLTKLLLTISSQKSFYCSTTFCFWLIEVNLIYDCPYWITTVVHKEHLGVFITGSIEFCTSVCFWQPSFSCWNFDNWVNIWPGMVITVATYCKCLFGRF